MKLKQHSSKRQMAINMLSSSSVFILNLCVAFFLTPFIVGKLGTAAYGFIGLSNNIIAYTSILTIAINSMAGRFITIKVHENKMHEASVYMSSVFYSNLVFGIGIMILFILGTIYLNHLINIPLDLVVDVKTLFLLLGLSSVLGLMTGVISVGAFIRNRLDIVNVRNVIGSMMRVVLLLLLFSLFVPRLWYVGITVLVMNLYGISSNYYFFRLLTPELKIRRSYFDIKKIKEIATSGMWNILNSLSNILSTGLNLLLANLFVTPRAMGVLSISLNLPVLILGLFAMISKNFAPEFTRLYAIGDMEGLKRELLRAVRITGFLCSIPIAAIFSFGDIFYELWLPTENASLLYKITCFGSFGMMFCLPQEPLWQIFTITNQVKRSSVNLIIYSILTFITVIVSMLVIKDDMTKLFCIAGIRTSYETIRVLTFLPIYGAKCLGFRKWIFYRNIWKNFLTILLLIVISLLVKQHIDHTWVGLFSGILFLVFSGILINMFTVLNKSDRTFLQNRIKNILGISK